MASSQRASKTICSSVSVVAASGYVCRTCRNRLVQPQAQQIRPASGLSSARPLRRKQWATNGQLRPASSQSIASRFRPLREQPPSQSAQNVQQYVEAQNWNGLAHVGHHGHWKELPPDPQDDFEPWLDPTGAQHLERNAFLAYLYISIIECLSYKHMKQDPNSIFTTGSPSLRGDMSSLKIHLTSSGTISHLEDPQGALQARTEESGLEANRDNEESMELSIADMEEALNGAKFDFKDPLTFTIMKRFSQLTGYRIPDPLLNTVIRTDKPIPVFIDMLTEATKPKPKRFAEVLLAKQKEALDFASQAEADSGLDAPEGGEQTATSMAWTQRKEKQNHRPLGPNVMIAPRKITETDKEMDIGRWKVIERELKARDLPLYPHLADTHGKA